MDFTQPSVPGSSPEKENHSSGDSSRSLGLVSESPHKTLPSSSTTKLGRAWDHMLSPVQPSSFVEIQLVLLTFCTGIQDAISFPDYHCFASNQTGNTVFLMVAAILPQFNGDMFVTANIAAALGVFLVAAFVTGQISHRIGARTRIFLIACNFLQTCLVFAAAAIQLVFGVQESGPYAIAVVALLAAAAGSQVVQARSLAITEISTAMATAAWVDLVIDSSLFTLSTEKARGRNRRLLFLMALVLGSLFGALIWRNEGSGAALLVSGAGKLLVTALYLFSPGEKRAKATCGDQIV